MVSKPYFIDDVVSKLSQKDNIVPETSFINSMISKLSEKNV